MRASERAGFKEAIPTTYFSYVEGLMMQKTVRYPINLCVRTCQIQRSNPDGVFLIRRGIDDAEDGALSNKCVRQNMSDSKKQSRQRIFHTSRDW